jgi:hypothetical protein
MDMTCAICRDQFAELAIGTHITLMHPEVERQTGPLELWPDGGIVAMPEEMTPERLIQGRDWSA